MPPDPDLVERRRRTLERALDARPDFDLDELHVTLERLGLGVDEETLLAELHDLGFDVVDEAPLDEAEVAATDPEREAAEPEAEAERDDDDEEALVVGEGRGRARGERLVGWRRRGRMVVPFLGLVPVLAAVVIALAGGSGTATARAQTRSAADAAEAAEEAERPTGPAPTAPVGPGADPALAGGGDASLPFDEETSVLPAVGEGRRWREDVGTWSVLDARVVGAYDPDEDQGALLTVDASQRDLRMEVALPDAYDETGLAFSVDDGSYFLWAPAAGFPTIALYRVEDGEVSFVLHSQQSELGPGLRLGIHIVGTHVELLAGGAVVATYEDGVDSTRVGLAVAPGGAFGTFDDLVVDLALPA
ncbi:MAG TPA: hypothetical protein VK507_07750 [Iamia sp.]|nr:hypothetical protein [Iamia sp.]